MHLRTLFSFYLALIFAVNLHAAPVRLILDTDMQTDCDDAGALAVLHALADLGEVEILATPVGVLNPWSASCTDAINTYYGRPDIPVGQLKGTSGVNITSRFTQGIAQNFPNDTTAASTPDALTVYRQVLADADDNSVTLLSLGYMNNLQNLLNSPADDISPLTGAELIEQKIKVWVCMGGNFPDDYLMTGSSDNVNFRRDPDSVIDCVTNWPGRIEFVGREIGHAMRAGARLSQTPSANPVRRAYELYFSGSAQDRHCADIAAVLYAVRGLDFEGTTYWGIEDTGSVNFTGSDAKFQWIDPPDVDNQAYITEIRDPDIIDEELEDLMIQPPGPVVDQWARFETALTNTQSYSDPYRDVTLNVTYTSPSDETINFWGYYDGGQTWKLRFMPNETGTWQYTATFSDGQPGKSGTFNCMASDAPATISAYSSNPRWFGHQDGEPLLVRSFHAAGLFKFAIDDPADPTDGEKRTVFLDWAQAQGYNTMSAHFFSTRDATDSEGPKLWPLDSDTYQKVEMILDDLSAREMVAYAFTGFFGNSGPYPSTAADRTLYIRYCLARFAPYWNIIMNVGGFEVRDYLTDTEIRNLGAEINAANPFGHLIGAHQRDGNDVFRNEEWCSVVTLQDEITNLSSLSTYLLTNGVTGKPSYAQETLWMGNSLQPAWTLTDLRKHMWVHMMSAASYNAGDMNGNNESGFGGSLDPGDKIQARHDVPKMIWDFMESIPFHTLSPRQDLRNSGYLLANPGETYLCYLPAGGSMNLAVEAGGAPYNVTWINAQNPMGDQRSGGETSNGQGLTAPDTQDWLVYLTPTNNGGGVTVGDTIAWYHFDEEPGASDPGNPIVNTGSAGAVLNLTDTGGPDGRNNTGAGGYGATGYPRFRNAFDVLASGNGSYDDSSSGSALGGGLQTATAVPQSTLQGSDGAFTYEAMIRLGGITNEQTILAHDGDNGNRGFLFRVVTGTLSFYNGSSSITAAIPDNGDHAFAADEWFHAAVSYTGEAGVSGNLVFYWTALASESQTANQIGSATLSADLVGSVSNKLGVGTTTRNPFRFGAGLVDEVRISGEAKAADDFSNLRGPPDTDADGMPDYWESENELDPNVHSSHEDTDLDGIPDLLEFALGLDPGVQNTIGLPFAEVEGGYFTFSVTRSDEADLLDYQVYVSDDFTNLYTGTEYVTFLEDTPTLLKVRDNIPIADAVLRLMRLKVTPML
ncbi:MAG: DUF5060 domain-containing protein [Kiritimatiellae bacterium]|jgi:hypothetical protein|nr:DUF5060 domain-containing protein [Kiritimatiellia bacterium]